MKRRSFLLASVAAVIMAATSVSIAAGPGKGGGGPGGAGMGRGGPGTSVGGSGTGEQPQSQYKHRHRVGEKDTGRKTRAEGEKAGGEATSVAPMEIAPAK